MSVPSRRISIFLICVLLALLIGTTVVAANGGVDSPSLLNSTQDSEQSSVIIDVQNSSNYLSPAEENITQENHVTVGLDVAGAVASDSARLQGEQRQRVLERALEGPSANDTLELDTVNTVESNVGSLEQQQQQLLREYSNGEIETSTLIREVIRLRTIANQYQGLAETVQEERSMSESVSLQYSNIRGEIMLLPSPLVSDLETSIRHGDQTPLYVQAGNDSLVLARVAEDTYIREAVMFGERDRESPEQFGAGDRSEADDAFTRAKELYPWTMDDALRPELRGFGNSSVYRLQASHAHGDLETYIDGATTNPFYERQTKNPFSVPVTDFTQTADEGLRLSVEATAPTGPLRIDVLETSGEAEDITLYIDGDPVGTVTGEGDVWTIQPRGSFEVTAETETGDSVTVLVF